MEYTIDKVNLTNAYCKYVKKFISCASVCELIFLLLILLAVSYNNFTAAIICCILFVLVIIIVFKKEFMRLKEIGDVIRIIDLAGTEVASYVYDACGNIKDTKGDPTVRELSPIRYRGYVYDTETDLYY